MITRDHPIQKPVPTYEIAQLFPAQGDWSEADFLGLDTNRLAELNEGKLEVMEMPTYFHQLIVMRLVLFLFPFVANRKLGQIAIAPLRVRLWPGKIREPDLVFISAAHANRVGEQYWGLPDLAAEIISESDPDHDRITKMAEYAQAGIPEYWIIDPYMRTVEVYLLAGAEYQMAKDLAEGETLTTTQLPGFALSVTELFAPE